VSRRTAVGLVALALTILVAAGCGAVKHITSGNPAEGKTIFVNKCGSCHTLANAKTQGTIGPNLDYAFQADKQQGFHDSTIIDVVRGQIAYPDSKPGTVCEKGIKSHTGNGLSCTATQGMPANLVHGGDARNVSVYVGLCAAEPNCQVKNETVKIPS
jgi:hypothetical protein